MLSNPKAVDAGLISLAEMWAPQREESVCEWVENNVVIPTGAITGKAQMSFIPYGREILDRYADKTCRHLVLVFPTQSGKTSLLIFGMLYRIARDPEDALWIMANTDQARSFNKERLMPFARACKPVMDLIPRTTKGAIDKHLWGFNNQHYNSCVLNFVGAGSPANLSSRPRGLLSMDECNKFAEELRFDAGTIALAEERQKTFAFPMSIKASSPTLADRMISVEYRRTDMRKYWIPCPRCEKEILLHFKIKSDKHGDCGLRWWHEDPSEAKTDGFWDYKKVRALAHYKCQCCGGMIHSFERQEMIEVGKWKASNERAETGRFGYQLNSLYSILGQETSLGSIAVKFLLSKGVKSELQNFINGWLAEDFDESMAYDQKDMKLTIFTPQEIPEDSIPIMAIDCQEGHFWVLVRKFQRPTPEFPNGQSWLLYADRCDTEEELVELQREYGVQGENVSMDMAWRPSKVGKIIIQHGFRGVWGSDTKKFRWVIDGRPSDRPYSVPQFRDPMLGTSWESRTFKRVIYCLFSKQAMLDLVSSLRYTDPSIFHITVNVNPAYSRHMNSRIKRKQKNKRTGRIEYVWVNIHNDDHLADCESHAALRALQLGLLSPPGETDQANVET